MQKSLELLIHLVNKGWIPRELRFDFLKVIQIHIVENLCIIVAML